jgi:hypothetical protein
MDVCSGRSTVRIIAISTSVVILEYDESGSGTRCKRVDTDVSTAGNVRCCETECTVNHNYLCYWFISEWKCRPRVHGLLFEWSEVKPCTCDLHFHPEMKGQL